MAFHEDEVRVSPGSDEAHERETYLLLGVCVFQPGGVDVALEVIYANEWQLIGQRQALGCVNAYKQ